MELPSPWSLSCIFAIHDVPTILLIVSLFIGLYFFGKIIIRLLSVLWFAIVFLMLVHCLITPLEENHVLPFIELMHQFIIEIVNLILFVKLLLWNKTSSWQEAM